MAGLRSWGAAVLAASGEPPQDRAARASGFVNLALGDAYLEAAIGLDDPDRQIRFAAQIEHAIRFATAD